MRVTVFGAGAIGGWIGVRLAQAGRILPSASRGGGGPVRDTSVPRWAEVVAVVNLCRGFEVADRPDQLPVGAVEPRRFVA